MAFRTYMLRCSDGRYHVGHTDDLDRRMAQRAHGGFCDFTARRRPVELIWSEYFQTRDEALTIERKLKGWSRAKKEALVREDWGALHQLAVSREARPSTSLRTNGIKRQDTASDDAPRDQSYDSGASGLPHCAAARI